MTGRNLFLLLSLPLMCIACVPAGKEEPAEEDAVLVDGKSFTVGAAASVLQVTVKANVPLESSSDSDWITPAGTRALTSSVLEFNVRDNVGYAARKAVITVTGGKLARTVNVTQNAFECSISFSVEDGRIPAGSGEYSLTLQMNVESAPWTISSDADWLTFSKLKGEGGATVKVSARRNGTDSERRCTLTVDVAGRRTDLSVVQMASGSAILMASEPGVYDIVDDFPVGRLVYGADGDQYAFRLKDGILRSRIQNYDAEWVAEFSIPSSVKEKDVTTLTCSVTGVDAVSSGTVQASVLKRQGGRIWLMDDAGGTGYVLIAD